MPSQACKYTFIHQLKKFEKQYALSFYSDNKIYLTLNIDSQTLSYQWIDLIWLKVTRKLMNYSPNKIRRWDWITLSQISNSKFKSINYVFHLKILNWSATLASKIFSNNFLHLILQHYFLKDISSNKSLLFKYWPPFFFEMESSWKFSV